MNNWKQQSNNEYFICTSPYMSLSDIHYILRWRGVIFNMNNGAVLAFDLILEDAFMIVCELQ